MEFKRKGLVAAALFSGLVSAQVAPPRPQFGQPVPGLTAAELAAFNAGREAFVNVETPQTGLGPIFNGRSCVECHGGPAPGGASPINVTRFGRSVGGAFDPLEALGGSLLQRFALDPSLQERIPREANVVARRQSTPLWGMGLVEAIPDAAIRAAEGVAKPDGVRGRAATVIDVVSGNPRVGRFGWKAQQATVLAFSADAYRNEMGITNRWFPTENAPNGNAALLAAFDTHADPEDVPDPVTGLTDAESIANFMRLLGVPPTLPATASSRAGEALFAAVGCALCHTPTMATGRSPIAALDRKPVPLYSDLLLHDMGTLNDGIGQDDARPNEMKTPPLWGLRASAPYLHDGRAATIDEAVRLHDGEARRVRDRYIGLGAVQRQQILDFLGTL